MKRGCLRYKVLALSCLAFLFSPVNPALAQGQAAPYLCELGKSFYSMGQIDEALSEFNKALLVDPDNQVAREYINRIFAETVRPSLPSAGLKPVFKPAVSSTPVRAPAVKPELTKEEAMDLTLKKLKRKEDLSRPPYVTIKGLPERDKKDSPKLGPLRVTGDMMISFGVTPDDFIWKRANFDLNEKSKSFRMSSDNAFDRRFNTFDPRIYDSLNVNLDTENKDGFNFHTNVTVDPWSFTGKSSKSTIAGSNGDLAEVELFYWSNTGYILNRTVYTGLMGDTINIPEVKVEDGQIDPTTVISNRTGASFTIPGTKIYRQFQPVRELWLDYANDQNKLRIFPLAYQDQAYSSDDPMGITNHHIWWQDSPWLRKYSPGIFNSADPGGPSFTKGIWDDTLSFISKDSTGRYLTGLRGFSYSFQPQEETTFDTTFATPKHLWQDYGEVDNVINATRIKHHLTDNFMVGGTFTGRLGYKVEEDNELDSQNYVGGLDFGYEIADGLKAQGEVLTSQSFYDQSNSDYKTDARGNAYYLSFVTRYPRQSIMDLRYGYDEISLDKTESFLVKSKFYLSRMDRGFDASLSNFHNTRQDTFWSRHIHFRRPFDYYYAGLDKPSTNWDELNATRIGDGIDAGRNVVGFRVETVLEDCFTNLFDVRNVHDVNGKFIENVVREELTLKLTDKLTAKGLGIYQKLPHTVAGTDPFIYDGNTGKFFINNSVPDGQDPTLKTGSFGLNYDLFDWLSIDGIYERTNDYYLAYDGFPANTLRNDTTLGGTFFQDGKLYRFRDPFLFSQGVFPQAPYEFFNVFKTGLRMQPLENMDVYLDYTRNTFESAGQNSDSMNHVGIEMAYMPTPKLGLALKYTYSRWQDTARLVAGDTKLRGYHNFFGEFRYLPSKDDEFTFQYGEGNTSTIGNSTLDPYGGTLLTIDTAHIFRAYYRRRF
ncbi:MAG: tetratricopeptide repeat protein [Candidatus Omnitrophica bacterium]|nr:tetratricopeptide repeat protein [Candidatus Omnitrophota bacterium]